MTAVQAFASRLAMTAGETFAALVEVMHRLRAPGGCPWDGEQSHKSLKPYLIEEAYEVIEALDAGDDDEFCNELGDLLLQVLFHAEIAQETDRVSVGDKAGRRADSAELTRVGQLGPTTRERSSAFIGRRNVNLRDLERDLSANFEGWVGAYNLFRDCEDVAENP